MHYFFRIDPRNNHIDLSLRGKDVGGPDLCPSPPKRKSEDATEDISDVPSKKGKQDVESSDEEIDDALEVSKGNAPSLDLVKKMIDIFT